MNTRRDDGRGRRITPGRLILMVAVVIVGLALSGAIHLSTQDEVTLTVSETKRVYKHSSTSDGGASGRYEYIVRSEEGETFTNVSNFFALKFRSGPLQRSLQEGEEYTCKVSGFRSFFPNSGRNLLSCDPEG